MLQNMLSKLKGINFHKEGALSAMYKKKDRFQNIDIW